MEVCLWLTPKIFDDITNPAPGVHAFFDHHQDWCAGRKLTVVFATGNGDHVLNYSGDQAQSFDWARYNCYTHGGAATTRAHNLDWLTRVREGGERSYNPYSAGPMFVLSEQPMDYHVLAGIYAAFRAGAAARNIDLTLLEYLEPGPEFCHSEWKTERHPEVSAAAADAGGHMIPGVIDVTLPLYADFRTYAAWPAGIPAGTSAGDFVGAQTAAFARDFALDGVLLGNQFGLLGFWHPDKAPEPTPERAAGIERFFTRLRNEMGTLLVYWMDTYWRAEVERSRWAMSDTAYATLDAILVSTFAVLVERTEIAPNVRSKAALRANGTPRVLYGLDFVDPWYWYRTHLDDIRTYRYQRDLLPTLADEVDGVSFFANDTFGHHVPTRPLAETLEVVRSAERTSADLDQRHVQAGHRPESADPVAGTVG